jgi:hypothetical protein
MHKPERVVPDPCRTGDSAPADLRRAPLTPSSRSCTNRSGWRVVGGVNLLSTKGLPVFRTTSGPCTANLTAASPSTATTANPSDPNATHPNTTPPTNPTTRVNPRRPTNRAYIGAKDTFDPAVTGLPAKVDPGRSHAGADPAAGSNPREQGLVSVPGLWTGAIGPMANSRRSRPRARSSTQS